MNVNYKSIRFYISIITPFYPRLELIFSLSSFSIANEFKNSLIPIIKNVMEAIDLRTTSGKKLDMEPPVKAPSKLAKTRAEEEPKKTANGLFELPLIVKVASWVLSPSSATKTVRNVESNKLKTIYK